jgi:hypothetical protein
MGQDRNRFADSTAIRPSRNAQSLPTQIGATRSIFMWDVVMLALGLGFFAVAIGYAYACERL